METAVDVAGSAPVASEAVTEIVNDAPPAAPSMDDDLRGVWDKHNPVRDEGGKFAPKNPVDQPPESGTDQAVKAVADQTAEAVVEQVKAAIDAPVSWSAENKAKWSTLPPDMQAYIAQRDKESHDAISRAGQQIKAFEPIGKVIEQFGHVFQKNGVAPHDGIARMLAVNEMLETNAPAAIKEIARVYGVDLSGQAEQNAKPENAKVADLEARLARAESYLTAQQRQQVNAEQASLAREIADFAKDKPHFEAVRKVMAGLMQSGAAETLQDAYDRAVYADPTIRQSLLADEQKAAEEKRREEEAKRVKDAKKAAGVNVKGSPGNAPNARTLDDDLREIARKHYGR